MKGLFWGLLTIDLHFFTDHYPAENSKVKTKKFNSYVGGPATNAAITFSHLGGQAQLVTAIGKNPYKGMIFEELDEYLVEIYDSKSEEPIDPVFASIITNETSGSRTIFSYTPQESVAPPACHIDKQTKIALFDGFYMQSAINAAKSCKELGITNILDGGSWKAGTDDLLKYIDIAICSENFFPPGISANEDVTEYLLKKGVKKTAITRGQKPIITNEGEVNFLIEIPPTEIVDTLGAGDIFHGAFCYFYASTKNFLLALEKAAQVASFSCKYSGPRTWMGKE
jgi:sugar/nucleoside kinase (ribokinase family)